MQVIEDPLLHEQLVDIISQEYQLLNPRTGIHASDLIYCLTRSYWNKNDYLPPSEDEVMRFSIGLGLERVIVQYEATRVEPIAVCGCLHPEEVHVGPYSRCVIPGCGCYMIWLSPDFLIYGIHSELKTTRWGPTHAWADTWIRQVMAYCFATGSNTYNLAVLHIIQAVLKAYRITFTAEEVEDNWSWMMYRKEVLIEHIESKAPPKEFTYNEEWECSYCRYKLRCDLAASLRPRPTNILEFPSEPI